MKEAPKNKTFPLLEIYLVVGAVFIVFGIMLMASAIK